MTGITNRVRPSLATRVLVVDSTRIGAQLLAAALQRERLQVVHAGARAQDALAELDRKQVDVALISATLDGEPRKGFELTSHFRQHSSNVQVVLLVDQSDRDSVIQAFRAGAHGVFGRDDSLAALGKCVARVHQGQVWASSEQLRYVLEALVGPPHVRLLDATGTQLLAPREQEVVHWVAEGLSNREIAARLKLSENTVKNYMFRIFDKLGISKRVELVLYAASRAAAARAESGTAVNSEAALFQWCREAAEKLTYLPYALGEMFRDGYGVAADTATALMWFMIAEQIAPKLVFEARIARQGLEQRLSPEQIASARTKASQWLGARPVGSYDNDRDEYERAV